MTGRKESVGQRARDGEAWFVPGLLLVLVVGGWLRTHGINWGLPDAAHPGWSYHPDEVFHAEWARSLAKGDFIPQHFMYGGTLHYTVLNAFWRYADLFRAQLGGVNALANTLLVGRWCVVGFSLLTIVVVAATGRRLLDPATGLVAAALIALAPAHVFLAQNVRPDELGTLLAALAGLLGVAAFRGGGLGDRQIFVLGGVLMGVSSALRLPLAAFGVAPIAGLLASKGWRALADRRVWALLLTEAGCATVSYAVASPHTFLNLETVRAGFELQASYQTGVFLDGIDSSTGPRAFLWPLLREALGGPGYFLAVLGIVAGLWWRRRETMLLLGMTLPYLLPITLATWLVVRYTLPAVPFLVLLGALGWRECARRLPLVSSLVLASAIGFTLLGDVAFARIVAGPNVRDQLAHWLVREVPAGDTIVSFRMYGDDEFFTPTMPPGVKFALVDVTGAFDPRVLATRSDIGYLIVPEPVYRGLDRLAQSHPYSGVRHLGELLAPAGAYELLKEFKLPVGLAGLDFSAWFRSQDFFIINPGLRVYRRR